MLDVTYPYRKDEDEDDEAFLEQLYGWRATDLKVRQINHLAGLCRLTEFLPRDEIVANVMRATRTQDSSEQPGGNSESNRFA
jgi:hypothetical protein